MVGVLLTAKPYFLRALLPTAVCNFPFFVPFKLLKKESIQKAVMGSPLLNFPLSFFFLTSQADSLTFWEQTLSPAYLCHATGAQHTSSDSQHEYSLHSRWRVKSSASVLAQWGTWYCHG